MLATSPSMKGRVRGTSPGGISMPRQKCARSSRTAAARLIRITSWPKRRAFKSASSQEEAEVISNTRRGKILRSIWLDMFLFLCANCQQLMYTSYSKGIEHSQIYVGRRQLFSEVFSILITLLWAGYRYMSITWGSKFPMQFFDFFTLGFTLCFTLF